MNEDDWLAERFEQHRRRVALDMLRARHRHGEAFSNGDVVETTEQLAPGMGLEKEVVLEDSIGAARLVVPDTLTPTERLAFVLHHSFAVPFEQIGAILDRSPDAAKQLAHRARRKVRGIGPGESGPGLKLIRPASGRSSTPSSLRPAAATSARSSSSCTPTSSSGQTRSRRDGGRHHDDRGPRPPRLLRRA